MHYYRRTADESAPCLSSVHNDKLYGDEYRWDRCGELSPKCQQHFVDEACFYECDHHAGKYRMHEECVDGGGEDNGWQVRQLRCAVGVVRHASVVTDRSLRTRRTCGRDGLW